MLKVAQLTDNALGTQATQSSGQYLEWPPWGPGLGPFLCPQLPVSQFFCRGRQATSVLSLSLSCMILGKSLKASEPQGLICKNGNNTGLLPGVNEVAQSGARAQCLCLVRAQHALGLAGRGHHCSVVVPCSDPACGPLSSLPSAFPSSLPVPRPAQA